MQLRSRGIADSQGYRRLATGMALMLLLLGFSGFSGCSSAPQDKLHDLSKAMEERAFDDLARVYSEYCQSVYDKGLLIDHLRVEMTREIRQSPYGSFGPLPPPSSVGTVAGTNANPQRGPDANTRNGGGPLVLVYCRGDDVPPEIWKAVERYWKD